MYVTCHAKRLHMALHSETKVVMYTGELRKPADIKVGDLLMGPDSQPRKVLTLKTFYGPCLAIKPVRGKSFTAHETQPLVLKKSDFLLKDAPPGARRPTKYRHLPQILPIRVREVIDIASGSLHKTFFLFKAAVAFPGGPTPIDPYFLGLWLGDGTSHRPAITTADAEIVQEVYHQASLLGLTVSINYKKHNTANTYTIVRGNVKGFSRRKNPLQLKLEAARLLRNKHIPPAYLYNSETVRLQLLAGIIDTDGYLSNNVYEVSQKSRLLSEHICFLANSLGFRAFIKECTKQIKSLGFTGNYYTTIICGNLSRVPVRLPRKKAGFVSPRHDRGRTGFRIHDAGNCLPMISITTDHDNRFLLEDFTVLSGYEHQVPSFGSYSQGVKDRVWVKNLEKLTQFVIQHKRMPTYSDGPCVSRVLNWAKNHLYRKSNYKLPLRRDKIEHFSALLNQYTSP